MNIAPILKARFIVVALAGLLVSALLAGQASAYEFWAVDSACGHGHRISAGSADWDANCLSAGWDNTPPFSSGVAGGSTHWVRSNCSQYGVVYVSVDAIDYLDSKIKLTDSAKFEDKHWTNNVRDIACCINHGDNLCFKRQIEGDWIKHVTVSGGSWSDTWVDVRTQKKRYNFCQDNPDDIYCKVDPQGDAHVTPPPLNCGDHYCTAGDCEWRWERSSASETCMGRLWPGWNMTISAEEGESQTCTVTTECNTGAIKWYDENQSGGEWIYDDATFSAEVLDMDDLHNCSGVLQVGAC